MFVKNAWKGVWKLITVEVGEWQTSVDNFRVSYVGSGRKLITSFEFMPLYYYNSLNYLFVLLIL